MAVRIAQFMHAANDVLDEAFLRDFPEVEVAKAHNLESLAKALDGAPLRQSVPPRPQAKALTRRARRRA